MSDETRDEIAMGAAILEAERARGSTGDNPWVGSVITDASGLIVARGHTRGPGEDHAEIGAMREAAASGVAMKTATLYSTLEPCAFHGRTPACAHAIVTSGVRRVVVGILDPNPRVDGEGLAILERAGIEVVRDVRAEVITRQLSPWLFGHHPHEPLRRVKALASELTGEALFSRVAALYGLDEEAARALARSALGA